MTERELRALATWVELPEEHDLAPAVRLICQEAGVTVRQIYKLFTAGPARGACRVAGLPKPDGCV